MRQWTVKSGEKDQRFNKYLQRKLPDAPSSFLYKMLRKKNITLNGKKASGSELLLEGDLVTLFLSDETIAKFGGPSAADPLPEGKNAVEAEAFLKAYRQLQGRIGREGILYEDDHVLLVRKPVGVLSQKASEQDRSMNEWLIGYLIEKGDADASSFREFKPSVCNRLDRNTGGILLCAKSLAGARKASLLLRDRSLHKYYMAVVLGTVKGSGEIEGYLRKNEMTNTVNFEKRPDQAQKAKKNEKGSGVPAGASWTRTTYRTLISGSRYSLLELELVTGKTHQIRSHLASVGHPILGDPKYGDQKVNERIRSAYGLRGQMLWCCRLEFPHIDGELRALSDRKIVCDPPSIYREIVESGS